MIESIAALLLLNQLVERFAGLRSSMGIQQMMTEEKCIPMQYIMQNVYEHQVIQIQVLCQIYHMQIKKTGSRVV